MKKIFYIAAAALAAGCSQAPKYQLAGRLDSLNCETMLVQVYSAESLTEIEYTDTIAIPNGDFAYNLRDQSQAHQILLAKVPKEGERIGSDGYIFMMLLPGEQALFSGSWNDKRVSGSQFYQDEADYKKSTAAVEAKLKALEDEAGELHKNMQGDEPDEATQAALQGLQARYEEIMKEAGALKKQWILDHPDADYAAYLAARDEELVAALSDRVRNGVMAQYVNANLALVAKQKAREENAKRTAEGNPAPDFTLLRPNGEPLSLSQLRGKIVVVDFWGSWCHWCIKGIPAMKEAYQKHAGKIEILSIACNDTDETWRKALDEHQMPWPQVINGKEDKDVSALYGISGYPTKVIVDAQGTIAKVVVGESPEFYQALDELCK